MKKILLIIFILLCVSDFLFADYQIKIPRKFSVVQPNDKWFSFDKWQHFSTSFIITMDSYYQLDRFLIDDKNKCKKWSVSISLTSGLVKEIFDVSRKRNPLFSWKDIVFDISGAIFGIVVINNI
ncbi:MAG: hypothetical protein PF551_07220 [Candidatus Marinimicrobia bacterium]|jgi:uncharacterized protein YfiM (DUF2279 family)|nr:hypothetical protein [Candidatus Neomarinimicrobiota bacterium]